MVVFLTLLGVAGLDTSHGEVQALVASVANLREARDILHASGVTTLSDGAFGTLDLAAEARYLEATGLSLVVAWE